jgi:hypoxanthine-DNA glycosylase
MYGGNMLKGFKYIANEDSKFLILGTFPGEESRKVSQYYGNSRNHFWKILFEIFNETYSKEITYEEKIQFLLKYNIALWDVIDKCMTDGSLDSEIKNPVFNNIQKFIKEHNNILKIYCNGQMPYKYLKKQNIQGIEIVILPSSSPTNTQKYDYKLNFWKENILNQKEL